MHNLLEYLQAQGHKLTKEQGGKYWFRSPFSPDERTASFVVAIGSSGKWIYKDFSTGKGGDAIQLVQALKGLSYLQALAELEAYKDTEESNPNPLSFSFIQPCSFATEVIAHYPLSHPNNLRYVERRGVPLSLAKKYLYQVQYSNPKGTFWGIGWKNTKGGWEITSVGEKRFKTCTCKAPTVYGTGAQAVVFEGVFDFLSYLAYRGVSVPPVGFVAVILNSVETIGAIDWKQYGTVYYFGDNDSGGDTALSKIQAETTTKDCRGLFKGYKDLNEWAVSQTH